MKRALSAGSLSTTLRSSLLSLTACLLVTACGTAAPAAPAPETPVLTSARLELAVSVATSTPTALAVQAHRNPTLKRSSFDSTKPSLASRGGSLVRLTPAELKTFNADGYTLENEQVVQGFGAGQPHLELLQAEQLWQVSRGEGVTVAVIDSGVDINQPALQGALLPGYDFINNTFNMTDESGHGTAVAVLIAGRGETKGLAPAANILPLRVLDKNDQGSSFDVTRAVLYAADLLDDLPNPHRADVINLSLGNSSYSAALHTAIQAATDAGITVVAAAGNETGDLAYPAALPEVIAVGAGEVNQGRWRSAPYSNRGEGLALLAPLGGLSDTNWGRYGEAGVTSASLKGTDSFVGTSFAAPQVSGLVALLKALGKDSAAVESLLYTTSSDVGTPGWDAETGYGVINPLATLRAAQIGSTHPIAVQLMDAGSRQESTFHGTQEQTSLELTPGRYRLNAWSDTNQDGVWQPSEPSYRSSEVLELTLEAPVKLAIRLD